VSFDNTRLSDASAPDVSTAPTRAEISLAAVTHNLQVIKRLAGNASIMAVVKADAYGHGARRLATHIAESGVKDFAVATIPEALDLRDAGVEGSILVFSPPTDAELGIMESAGLDLHVSSLSRAETIASRGYSGRIHLKVDTGMTRVGVHLNEVEHAVRLLEKSPGIELHGIWTHLATADDRGSPFAEIQIERFRAAIASVRDSFACTHVANSGALLNHREQLDLDASVLVRPGITLYGLSPSPEVDLAAQHDLRPAMRYVSRVTRVQKVDRGTSVSYSQRWYADDQTNIATVQAGYADGYPRILTNKGRVSVRGREYPVAGTVCMDAFMIDAGADTDVAFGDEVILFGPGGPSCFEVARRAQTITYELTCRVSSRVPRAYIQGNHSEDSR
jgi:alanine racemase